MKGETKVKKLISVILCIAMFVSVLTVGAFAVDEEPTTAVTVTQEEQPPKGEIDELFDENEEEPDEVKFNYFKNLWLAFQSATMWTAFFPETLIASLILGIAGPPVAFMTVGYAYLELCRAIGGVPVNDEFCLTFKDGWNEIKRFLSHKFLTEG